MNHAKVTAAKQSLIWNLLFIDAFVLLLRYGGIAVADLMMHACFLLGATLLLLLHRRVYAVPRLYLLIFGLTMGIALVQLIPLPEPLFALLAPVKHRIVAATGAIFPGLALTTEITMLRDYHIFKVMSLILDCYLIMLLIMAPRPPRGLFRFWLPVFSLTVGSLAIIAHSEGAAGEALLGLYKGTYGGLVNRNHFVAFTAILMVFNLAQVLSSIKQIRDEYSGREMDTALILRHGLYLLCCLCCMFLLFLGFRVAYSRSGILNMVIIHGVFLALLIHFWWKIGIARKTILFAGTGLIVVGVTLLLLLPLGRSIDKLEKEGIEFSNRLTFNIIGVNYLRELPILGTGIGSTESLLPPVEPKPYHQVENAQKYHNEFLQVAVEFGIVGLGLLVLFLVRIGHGLWSALEVSDFYRKTFLFGTISMVVMLAVLSLFSFPLRITSIRLFVILLVFIGIKSGWTERDRKYSKARYLVFSVPFVVAALAWFFVLWRTPMTQEAMAIAEVRETVTYGTPYKANFYVANNRMRDILANLEQDPQEIRRQLQTIEDLISGHLGHNPFHIKAMNLLFMTELIESKMDSPQFDPERHRLFKDRAKAIRALSEDANINSRLALMFLYASEETSLTEEEATEYAQLRATYDWNLRVAGTRMNRRKAQIEAEKKQMQAPAQAPAENAGDQ